MLIRPSLAESMPNSDVIERFKRTLHAHGWECDGSIVHEPGWPLAGRYGFMSNDYVNFLSSFASLVRSDQGAWFLSKDDYLGKSGSAHRWNQVEVDCLSGSNNDLTWQAEIRSFWDKHCPIGLQVVGRYSYVAIRQDAVVVIGAEPEYENTNELAPSFSEFLLDVSADRVKEDFMEFIGDHPTSQGVKFE
jgi:hypothetical protein